MTGKAATRYSEYGKLCRISPRAYNEEVPGRIYTDTSVIGGCEDDEFWDHSRRLMDAFIRGDLTLVLSELTLRELAPAPPAVRQVLTTVPDSHIEMVRLTPAADELARRYLAEGILKANMLADAQHIAMATIANVDVLVSWNFRHVVNLPRIHGYNGVNARLGYPTIEIRSPREVFTDD